MAVEKLEAALDAAVSEARIVGGVHLVSESGERFYQRAVGHSDREAGRTMAPETRFRLASVAKPIMTIVFMSLVEDGTIALDDPVTKFLPAFRPTLPDGRAPVITLHHLLTHTSGLGYRFLESEDGPYARANISDGLDQPGLSMAENLTRIASAFLYFEPGTAWRYSVGLDVMGAVAEAATGQTLQDLLDARVSVPLGLTSLRFHTPPAPDLATPYFSANPTPERMSDGIRPPLWGEGGVTFAPSRAHDAGSFPSCGAGLVGSAQDVVAVLESIRGHGPKVLNPDTIAAMTRSQIPADVLTLQGPGIGFGYGWGIVTDPVAANTGQPKGTMKWGGVYGNSWFMDPVNDRISVLLTNTAYEGMSGTLPADIVAAFYG